MRAADFFEAIKKKHIGVIGIGVSHFELIGLLLKKGIKVTVLDKRDKEQIQVEYDKLSKKGASFRLGASYLDNLTDFDIVFRTPGMYFNSGKLQAAISKGVVVTSEMEVFFDICPCRIFGVTGSDGKTTTTTLIGEMLKAQGKNVFVGGNIGRALLPLVEDMKKSDICVVELSSFQLISMRRSPDVAVVTNISPNHLDVHKDMDEYVGAKVNLLAHQNAFSRTILNLDNVPTAAFKCYVRGETCHFSRFQKPQTGSYIDENGDIYRVKNSVTEKIMHSSDILLPGIHNVENYLAAIAAVQNEVDAEHIKRVARTFGGVEHRIEYVKTIDGVKYYNDSIATSPTRTIAGLKSFSNRIIIIAGGYDKNISYAPLAPVICQKVKLLILLGATAPKIEKAVREFPEYNESELSIVNVSTLEEAVLYAREHSVNGDIVSLSPASASFDLYKNFEERGAHFKRIVNELK